MRGYATKVFTIDDVVLFERARLVVDSFEDGEDGRGEDVRCHEVARAVAQILGIPDDRVQDGRYALVEHSWIWLRPWREGQHPPNILEAYAVARFPLVQLVEMGLHVGLGIRSVPDSRLYDPGSRRTDVRAHVVERLVYEHRRSVDLRRHE